MAVGRFDDALMCLDVPTLRKIFKGLECWRASYEDHGIDMLTWDGLQYHIMDIEALYSASQTSLAPRQAQSIALFLVGNLRETDVARIMGIAPTNPIGMYATDGLCRLIEMVQQRILF